MGKSFCELPLLLSAQTSEYEELQSTYIAACVLNGFLCYSAVMLNCAAIYAIRKTSSLPKTLKALLLSLAVSDVGVGLLGQPLHISLLVMWLQQSNPGCSTHKALFIVSSFFCLASFSGVKALSVDRSSSQISGTCDSQACCFCGDHVVSMACPSCLRSFITFIVFIWSST